MELLKAIYQRRAVREFSDATVTPALVHDLLHAAAQAPSALNLQPWSFAVLHGRARLADYSRRAKRHLLATSAPTFGLDPRIDHYANPDANLFHGADTLVVICAKPGPFASVEDCFLAAQNLMLAAHGFGLGTCPVGFARAWFNRPEVKAELGIPPHHEPVLPITLGHPAQPPPAVPRHEPETVCWHWDA
ncbi:MAG: nitroreductase [Opitutaceae bacterium]|nr:nitroreductase [Opitutaceae bacterium]